MKNILNKLTNTTTVLSIIASLVLILQTCGLEIDNEKVTIVVNSICSILVLLGIMNNNGMDSSEWNK